jgi:C4-dicarboxylate-specific signal transduction histidine kinase
VSQVLLNLLNNAFDAVEMASEKWVVITFEVDSDKVSLAIVDSGSGISSGAQAKLFQPFFTTKPVGKGTGLGLSISKGIIESHQGQLSFDKTCVNTKFVITLPRTISADIISLEESIA